MTITVEVAGGGVYSLDPPATGQDLLERVGAGCDRKIVAWHVNRYLRPLDWPLREDSVVDFVDTSSFEGMSVYRDTLTFVLSLACRRALGEDIFVRHSISDGYYCELQSGPALEERTSLVRQAVEQVIRRDLPIKSEILSIDAAERILHQQNEPDTADLLKYAGVDPVTLYRCDGIYGFFHGPLAPSTGSLTSWDLVPFRDGMVLRFPTVAYPLVLPPRSSPMSSTSTAAGCRSWGSGPWRTSTARSSRRGPPSWCWSARPFTARSSTGCRRGSVRVGK
mgnify:CR=1 FL=1